METKIYKVVLLFCLYIVSVSLGITIFYYANYSIDTSRITIDISDILSLNDTYETNITYDKNKEDLKCMIDDNNWLDIDNCKENLEIGNHTVYLKNNYFEGELEFVVENKINGSFSSSIDVLDKYYLALGGKKTLNFTFDYPDEFDKTVTYFIEDENIIEINDNIIFGKNVGTTTFIAYLTDGNKKTYTVEVTNLIQPATLNNNKSYLPCKRYTEEEAHKLDEILDSRVKEAGYGTRGGTIAAARFITLEFPYSIRYFNENGRLVGNGIDGEGRYYHVGLYLSEDKYKTITKSTSTGPRIWG